MPKENSIADEMIAIELPVKYWGIILTALAFVIKVAVHDLDAKREAGFDIDVLLRQFQDYPALVTLSFGPARAFGTIVDALVEKGIVAAEVGQRLRTKAPQEIAEWFAGIHV